MLALLLGSAGIVKAEYSILVLGDSLTEGYGLSESESFPSMLENRLLDAGYANIRVINGGSSGATSASALNRLRWYIRSQPDLLFLAMGANDGLRGLSIAQLRQNLSEAIEFAQENDIPVTLAGMLIPPNYGEEYSTEFARVYPTLAREYDIPLLPFLLEGVAAIPELNQADGIHPNAAGNRIVADTVYEFLLPLLPSP